MEKKYKMEVTTRGKVENGKLKTYNREWFFDQVSKHDGDNVTITVKFHGKDVSEMQKGYFRDLIVPEMQKAFAASGERYTRERTEQVILSYCPDAIEERLIGSQYVKHVLPFEQLTMQQASAVIDTIKQIAAQHFNYFIP